MNSTTQMFTCQSCGATLSRTHSGPCPGCGKVGMHIAMHLNEGPMPFKDALAGERRAEFLEENPRIKWLLRTISFGSPLVGLIFAGAVGVLIGLGLGLVSHLLGPYAVIKVREILKFRSE